MYCSNTIFCLSCFISIKKYILVGFFFCVCVCIFVFAFIFFCGYDAICQYFVLSFCSFLLFQMLYIFSFFSYSVHYQYLWLFLVSITVIADFCCVTIHFWFPFSGFFLLTVLCLFFILAFWEWTYLAASSVKSYRQVDGNVIARTLIPYSGP